MTKEITLARKWAKLADFPDRYGTSKIPIEELGISRDQAKKIVDLVLGAYPDLVAWIAEKK